MNNDETERALSVLNFIKTVLNVPVSAGGVDRARGIEQSTGAIEQQHGLLREDTLSPSWSEHEDEAVEYSWHGHGVEPCENITVPHRITIAVVSMYVILLFICTLCRQY